jgi:hypothetical protein
MMMSLTYSIIVVRVRVNQVDPSSGMVVGGRAEG